MKEIERQSQLNYLCHVMFNGTCFGLYVHNQVIQTAEHLAEGSVQH